MKQGGITQQTHDAVIQLTIRNEHLIDEVIGINKRLDLMNGKLYKHEGDITEIQEQARHTLTWKKFAGITGGVLSAVFAFFIEFIRKSV